MNSVQNSEYLISAVMKAFDVIEMLAQQDRECSLAEIAEGTGIPKSSVFRYLATLESRGYVERTLSDSAYRLGTRIFELANQSGAHADVRKAALPYMQELRFKYSETVNLAILSHSYVVYLEILESKHSVRMAAQVGARDYPHSTALGKAMLAFLPWSEVEEVIATIGFPRMTPNTISTQRQLEEALARVREQGYAIDNNENEAKVHCIAAPIFDRKGRACAAVSISALEDQVSFASLLDMAPAVMAAATRISANLGHVESARRVQAEQRI